MWGGDGGGSVIERAPEESEATCEEGIRSASQHLGPLWITNGP